MIPRSHRARLGRGARRIVIALASFVVALEIFYPMKRGKEKELLLILYSGPTDLPSSSQVARVYDSNFRFFLKHALPCSHRVALDWRVQIFITLTADTSAYYAPAIARLPRACGKLQILERKGKCYDMESVRLFLATKFKLLHEKKYKFVYVNCGMVGPLIPNLENGVVEAYWPELYVGMLDKNVKLVGQIINCGGKRNTKHAHVGSELWATDAEGLRIILESGAVYDCGADHLTRDARDDLIIRYEMGISRAILLSGFMIRAQLSPFTFTKKNFSNHAPSDCVDIWWAPTAELWKHVPDSLEYPTFAKNSRRSIDKIQKFVVKMNALT